MRGPRNRDREMTCAPLRRHGRAGMTSRTLLLLCLLVSTLIWSSIAILWTGPPASSPVESLEELKRITRLYFPSTTQVICAERTNNLDVCVTASLDMATDQVPGILGHDSWPALQWDRDPTEVAEHVAALRIGYAARCTSLIRQPEKYGHYIGSRYFLHLALEKPRGNRVRMYLVRGIF